MKFGHHAQVRRFLQQVGKGPVMTLVTDPGDPFHDPHNLVPLAQTIELGSARALLVGSIEAYVPVSHAVSIPVIAAAVAMEHGGLPFATTTVASATALVTAGSRAVLVNATQRRRPGSDDLTSIVDSIHAANAIVLGIVNEPSDLAAAHDAGIDIAGTNPFARTEPDMPFLRWLVRHSALPVFAGGQFLTPQTVRQAIDAGAAFIIAGDTVTNPAAVTARFAASIQPRPIP